MSLPSKDNSGAFERLIKFESTTTTICEWLNLHVCLEPVLEVDGGFESEKSSFLKAGVCFHLALKLKNVDKNPS